MFVFKPFPVLAAVHDRNAIHRLLEDVATSTERTFRAGLTGGHSGRTYIRRGRAHQASAPSEYPANDTGALQASLGHTVSANEAIIGTGAQHSVYLAHGTSKIAKRKFVKEALQESVPEAMSRMHPFAHFKQG